MRVLVTGSTGFVGPYLVRHCVESGDDVRAVGDDAGDFDVTDRDGVISTFRRHQPEVVYHLAARSHIGESWSDPTACLRVNVEGTANVLDAARIAGAQRVLVVGSAEEYGRVADASPQREDAPLRPITPYGASKVGASFLALQAFLGSGLATIRVRAFSHTGPGQPDRFVIPALARRVAEAERAARDVIEVGALDPVRDVSDVRDVVRAYRLLVEHGEPGDVYNVCSGAGVSIAEIARRLVARSARPLELHVDAELVRPVDVPVLVGDPSKLRATTHWSPDFTLDETLDAVLEDARTRAAHGS